jgi:alpha-N-arabinofuranosidase
MAAKITVFLEEASVEIRKELYGHFSEHLGACIDEGIWVGKTSKIPNIDGMRRDVIDALRKLNPPVLRWPGGCYADDYHWTDGIGPRESRPRRVNIWWGQNIECNHFGTHEFIRLCELIGAQPYLAGNLGSGTVREMRDWVEYCNFAGDSTLARQRSDNGSPYPFNVKYWGAGNENWGCGGNFNPEDYAIEYRRYATYLRDFGENKLFLIACGPNGNNHEWTRRFFQKFGRPDPFGNARLHGWAAHYYCGTAGTALQYSTDQWYELLHKAIYIETLIKEQRALLDELSPHQKIGLIIDEWGTWHPAVPGQDPRYLWQQQSTMRDALVAALSLDIFNNHAEKLTMTNIAQVANVLQSLVLTKGEKLLLTPTYHIYDLYQSHQGAMRVRTEIESDAISFAVGSERRSIAALHGSASIKQGMLTLSVVNTHASLPVEATIDFGNACIGDVQVSLLAADDITAHNTFDEVDRVRPRTETMTVSPSCHYTFAPASVTVLRAHLA